MFRIKTDSENPLKILWKSDIRGLLMVKLVCASMGLSLISIKPRQLLWHIEHTWKKAGKRKVASLISS